MNVISYWLEYSKIGDNYRELMRYVVENYTYSVIGESMNSER